MATGSNLFRLLADLSENKNNKYDEFKSSPDQRNQVMDDYGLSDEQKSLINSTIEHDRTHDLLRALADEAHDHFYDSGQKLVFC